MAQFTIPSRQYTAGVHPFGPFTVATGSQIQVSLTRENWPDSAGEEIINIQIEISTDNGQTFDSLVGFGTAGGVLPPDKFGNPQTSNTLTSSLTTPCRLRGTVTLQQPLSTAVSVSIT